MEPVATPSVKRLFAATRDAMWSATNSPAAAAESTTMTSATTRAKIRGAEGRDGGLRVEGDEAIAERQ